jgi:hypothetical protein
MNSLRPLILITPCIIPRLLWTCLRISCPRSYHEKLNCIIQICLSQKLLLRYR